MLHNHLTFSRPPPSYELLRLEGYFFSLLLYLFFLFQLHLLGVNAKYCIQLFHLQIILYFFDSFLPLLLFYFQIFRSNPPVLNPSVFKSSCAINTYVLMLPCLINGYPAVPHAGFPNLLSKCTQVGVNLCGSTYDQTPRIICSIPQSISFTIT